jgi:hypothetical protein
VLVLVDVGAFVGFGRLDDDPEMISCGAWLPDSREARFTRVDDKGNSTRL